MSLKTKLIGSFLIIAVLSSITIFVGNQIAFNQIRNNILPSLSAVEQASQITRTLQAETLEYIATGEEETIEEIEETREEVIEAVATLRALNVSSFDAETFSELANNIEALAVLAQGSFESHIQTLEAAEELEESEELVEEAREEIAAQVQDEQLEKLDIAFEVGLTLQLEALEYLSTGEESSLAEFGESEELLQTALDDLAATLSDDQATILETFIEVTNHLAVTSKTIVDSHEATLEQLEELEDVEQDFSDSVLTSELLVDKNVNAALNAATTYTIVIAIMVLIVALIVGFVLANTIVRPVTHLVATTGRLSEGDYDQRASVDSDDEIGELANSFNSMAEAIQLRDKQIQDSNEQLVRQEKLAILGQLAGGVGHELRNPLASIKNGSVFLSMAIDDPDPMVQETLEIINKEVASSEHIISSLLDYARPKEPVRTQVAVNGLVGEAISRIDIPNRITVTTELDDQLPKILADQQQVHQIVDNIIRNGVQAMPDGGNLTVSTAQSGSEYVVITIKDTGQGMSAETLEKLFEPLYTTKATGMGLGMSVTKSLIMVHNGTIEVESELGLGTTFTIQLPTNIGRSQ